MSTDSKNIKFAKKQANDISLFRSLPRPLNDIAMFFKNLFFTTIDTKLITNFEKASPTKKALIYLALHPTGYWKDLKKNIDPCILDEYLTLGAIHQGRELSGDESYGINKAFKFKFSLFCQKSSALERFLERCTFGKTEDFF